jgi:hypothetical protein
MLRSSGASLSSITNPLNYSQTGAGSQYEIENRSHLADAGKFWKVFSAAVCGRGQFSRESIVEQEYG